MRVPLYPKSFMLGRHVRPSKGSVEGMREEPIQAPGYQMTDVIHLTVSKATRQHPASFTLSNLCLPSPPPPGGPFLSQSLSPAPSSGLEGVSLLYLPSSAKACSMTTHSRGSVPLCSTNIAMSGQGQGGLQYVSHLLGLVLLGIYGVTWWEWLVTLSSLCWVSPFFFSRAWTGSIL